RAAPGDQRRVSASKWIHWRGLQSCHSRHRRRHDYAAVVGLPPLHLDPTFGVPGVSGGVGGSLAVTMGFLIWVWLDGQEYPCQLQAAFAGHERILGRDVLNRLEILFRGPTGQIIVNPRCLRMKSPHVYDKAKYHDQTIEQHASS